MAETNQYDAIETSINRLLLPEYFVAATRGHVLQYETHMIDRRHDCDHAYFTIATVWKNFDVGVDESVECN